MYMYNTMHTYAVFMYPDDTDANKYRMSNSLKFYLSPELMHDRWSYTCPFTGTVDERAFHRWRCWYGYFIRESSLLE